MKYWLILPVVIIALFLYNSESNFQKSKDCLGLDWHKYVYSQYAEVNAEYDFLWWNGVFYSPHINACILWYYKKNGYCWEDGCWGDRYVLKDLTNGKVILDTDQYSEYDHEIEIQKETFRGY